MTSFKWVGISLAALAMAACESPEEKSAKFAENAQEYLEEGELARARLQFANALQSDPNNVAALRGAAEVAEREERWGDQLRYLQNLINVKPDDIDALADLSRLSLLSGEVDEAVERAERVLEVQPSNIEALTVMGAAMVLRNNLERATEYLERGLAEDPNNVEMRNLLAARYIRNEDYDTAQQIIEEGLAATPDSQALLVVKLLMAQRLRDADGMDETFQQLIDASPDNGFYRERYAVFLTARGNLEGAEDQYAAAIPLLEDKKDAVGQLIGIVRRLEGDEAAEARINQIIEENPDEEILAFALPSYLCEIGETERCIAELQRLASSEEVAATVRQGAKVELGERAFRDRNFDRARELANEVLAEDDINSSALTLRGKVELAEENVDTAIETLREALNSDPAKEPALILLGLAYEADGRDSFAEAQLAQAIDRIGLTPNLFQAYRGMLIRNGKRDEAADLTLRFSQTSEATPDVQRESAAVLIGQGREEEAETIARTLLRQNPSDAIAARILAASLVPQERYDEALEALDAIPDEEKTQVVNVRTRAEVLSAAGRGDDVRSYLRSAGRDQDLPQAYILLAQYELQNEANAAAAAALREGLGRYPGEAALYAALSSTLRSAGDVEGGQAAVVEGLEKAENKNALRLVRSNDLIQAGQRQEAFEELRLLAEAEALNDLAANNYAALLLDFRDEPQAALDVAQRFEGTEQPFFADTLAWAYYRTGNLEKALEYSTIAAENAEPQAEILYHHGVIQAEAGNVDAAREAFEKALEAPGKTEKVSEEAIRAAIDAL
ncbi:MAG: tetratricopeptide repeat protein [Parvularcula sp.]|jgi:tetratricopeptide (TPR) repeat protein|nr:tetratricopeptide repeat protein [Parvularcula sp.]